MSVSQFGDGGNGIESCVFSQGVGDHLHGLGEGLEAVGVGADQRVGVLHQLKGQLSF